MFNYACIESGWFPMQLMHGLKCEPLAGSLDSAAALPGPTQFLTQCGVRNVHKYDANQQTAIKVCRSKLCVSCELNEKHNRNTHGNHISG